MAREQGCDRNEEVFYLTFLLLYYLCCLSFYHNIRQKLEFRGLRVEVRGNNKALFLLLPQTSNLQPFIIYVVKYPVN